MGTQKLSEVGVFAVHIAAAHAIFAALVGLFLLHEPIGVLIQLFAHALVILEIGLQRRMGAYDLLVFGERGIAAKLLSDFLVFVQELIETDDLAVVGVTCILAGVVIRAVAAVPVAVVAFAHVVVVTIAICIAVIGVTIASVDVAAIVVPCVLSVLFPSTVSPIQTT